MIYHVKTTADNIRDSIYFEDDYYYDYEEDEDDDYEYEENDNYTFRLEDDYYTYQMSNIETLECVDRRAFPFPHIAGILVLLLASCWLSNYRESSHLYSRF